ELRLALAALPEARDWDEDVAAEWWREHAVRERAASPLPSTPLTVTRDLTEVEVASKIDPSDATRSLGEMRVAQPVAKPVAQPVATPRAPPASPGHARY